MNIQGLNLDAHFRVFRLSKQRRLYKLLSNTAKLSGIHCMEMEPQSMPLICDFKKVMRDIFPNETEYFDGVPLF